MTVREISCWPIQFSVDPFRQETRNVGLIVHDQGRTHCVMMGGEESGLDARFFCHAFGFPEAIGWVYAEWARWFNGLAGEAKTVGAVQEELDHLSKARARFGAGEPFGIHVPVGESAASAARRLFQELVTVPALPKRNRFEADVASTILRSEIEFSTTLWRNIELEIQHPDRPVFVRLPVFVDAPVRLGVKLMRFEGTTDNETASQANDILYSFDALTANGILDRKRCVVLHDRPTARRNKHLNRIDGHAHLMLLDDTRTPRTLWELTRPDRLGESERPA